MKQAELQQYRVMLQAQMAETPPKRRFFGDMSGPVMVRLDEVNAPVPLRAAGVPRRVSLFGRRRPTPQAEPVAEPLLLDRPAAQSDVSLPKLRLRCIEGDGHFAQTPFMDDDLADAAIRTPGPAPGIIAGWSAAKPPNAQTRLLRRLCAVVEAERVGLSARLAAAGIEAA